MEPWRDADAKNRGLEEDLQASGRRIVPFDEEQDPDRNQSYIRIRI